MKSKGARALHQQVSSNSSSVKQAINRSPAAMLMAKQDALRQLLAIGSLGLGVGVGGRSLLGLRNLVRDTQVDPLMNSSPIPTPVPIPLSSMQEEEEQPGTLSGLAQRLRKQAMAGAAPAPPQPSWVNTVVDKLAPVLPNTTTTQPLGDWWGPSAALGTGLATVGGGWMLTDWLLNKIRQQEAQTAEQEAEQDYRKALSEQYQAAMQAKHAGDDLGIDGLYEMVKEGDFTWGDLANLPYAGYSAIDHDLAQKLKGVTLAAMMATGLGAGKLTYDVTRNRNQQQLLQKAIKLRARQRQQSTPTPVYAVPEF